MLMRVIKKVLVSFVAQLHFLFFWVGRGGGGMA